MTLTRVSVWAGPALMIAAQWSWAQPVLTLEQAVRQAEERYPAVRVFVERANAAAAAIQLARTAYLPRAEAIAQVNRATTNNVYGMLLPQSVLAPISGPPVFSNRAANVFGTATGVLVNWEPFDFGFRKADVDAADAARRRAEAAAENTRFETGASAADAYLTMLAAEQQLGATEAGVARALPCCTSPSRPWSGQAFGRAPTKRARAPRWPSRKTSGFRASRRWPSPELRSRSCWA